VGVPGLVGDHVHVEVGDRAQRLGVLGIERQRQVVGDPRLVVAAGAGQRGAAQVVGLDRARRARSAAMSAQVKASAQAPASSRWPASSSSAPTSASAVAGAAAAAAQVPSSGSRAGVGAASARTGGAAAATGAASGGGAGGGCRRGSPPHAAIVRRPVSQGAVRTPAL
jgi:hypothetical protein